MAEALRKYSGRKVWCTRYANKINKSQPLLDKQYDRRMDEIVAENLKKAENEVAVMGQIAKFLVQKKFQKAKDHQEQVAGLEVKVQAPNQYPCSRISHSISSSRKTPPSRSRLSICEISVRIET